MSKYDELIAQAKTAYQKHELATAIAFYEEAFQEKIIVEDLVDLGFVYLDDKNPFKAVAILEEATAFAFDYPLGFYGLGMAYEEVGRRDDAIKAYQKVIELDEAFVNAYFNLALIYDDLEDENQAYNYYKKTLLYAPGHFWANLNIGSFYEKHDFLDL
ncbi:MAG TPA: tetratricopeptide repeat protein, partial [Bacilli bacterium]|nr:tetratricopeptide repeat protein [Bacilli bacterium]